MKHVKKILMILVIVFLLVGLTTLAATDVTHNDTNIKKSTDITKTDTINKDHIETQPAETKTLDKQNQIQKTQKDKNKKQDVTPINISNFNEFSNAINNGSQSTKILNITEGFTLGDNLIVNSGITKLTINGNQKTIYGNKQFRFLTINNGQTVELNNLNIINCFRITDGGAIKNDGNLTITNCNLSHNKADDKCGGAIANGGTGILYIENSNLTNNSARDGGGAIDNNGIAIITGSNLSYNTASMVGGAVMNYGGKTLNITNSSLSYNKADNGGAIRNAGNLTVTGSNITNNDARMEGGALSNVRGCKMSDTLIYNNTPANFIIDENNHIQLVKTDDFISVGNFTIITDFQTYQGNGIEELRQYTISKESINVKLLLNGTDTTDNTFIIRGIPQNPAPINISNYDELVNALNDASENIKTLNITEDFSMAGSPTINSAINLLIIEGNQKTIYGNKQFRFLTINNGQAVIINNLNLIHCFTLNDGGAINNNGYLMINNTNLTNHTAERCGGAIANGADGTLYIINSNLTNNTSTWDSGGAVDNNGIAIITGSNLTYNYAFSTGGAVINYVGKTLNITNSTLSYNRADDGGAIRNAGNLTVTGSNLTNNVARQEGGALSNVRGCKMSDTLLYNNNPANFIIDENNHIQLVKTDDFISVGDFTIITDYMEYHGNGVEELGQIIIPREAPNVKLLLNGTDTTDNTFIIRGTPEKIVPVNISNFFELRSALNDNTQPIKILNITADITLGGSPQINSNIKTLIINGNQHTIDGGKSFHFLTISEQNVVINNLTVIRCTSSDDGGAIVNEANLTIINSILNNNTASLGGAIVNRYGANLTIINSKLDYNNATSYGGAIGNDGNITIIGSALNYNGAREGGGAICNYQPNTINITNSSLTHNSADVGGAIFNYGNIIISDSYMAYNKANSEGSTIKNDGSYKISGTTFFNNTPDNFIINENNRIQLIHDDNFISVGDFRLIIDDQAYHGTGADELGQYLISLEASTIKIILNGTDTTDNAFYLKGNPGPINIKNYEELASALNNGVESIKILNITDNIILKSNLTVNSGITSLTIIGNQKIIDGNGSHQFLNITDGQNVIINDITIVDCNSTQEGGAIVNGGNLTITNSNLNNNHASWLGGAVYNGNKGNLIITNCNITNNKADGSGGAIENWGNLTILESNINYNTAQNVGAINNYAGLMTIVDSNITHNKANSEHGALYNNGRCNISGTFFYNNTPANFIINENNNIQLVNDDAFISISDFIIINDYQVYQGTGRDELEQYTIPGEAANVKLLLNGTNTTDNIFIIKGDDEIINSEKTRLTNKNPTCGSTTDIIATFIVDDNLITDGMVIFRLNGKTLRDNDGKVIYVNINEGAATLKDVPITNAWAGSETTIQAIFAGNDEFEPLYTDKLIISVSKREAQMELTAPGTAQAGETITLSASVTAGEEPVTTGRVAFKLNGKTLKDKDGKALYVNVVNGIATTTYTLPTKIKADTYILKAVFADNTYERVEKTKELLVTG